MMTPTAELIHYVAAAYASTSKSLANNVFRGHLRTISSDIEDGIAIFISKALPQDYKLFLDPSIHVGGKNNRPDLLVVDSSNHVVAMIEIKANMGWCRDASKIIDGIVDNDKKFRQENNLTCEFSTRDSVFITYGNDVKLYLLSLTDWNCPASKHVINRQNASAKNIKHYNLFTGWYDSLAVKEADIFLNDLMP